MPLPERVILTSSLDNISAVSFQSPSSRNPSSPLAFYHDRQELSPSQSDSKKLPYYQNFSLNAADIIIGIGYDLMDIYELTNHTLGGLILLQITSSWILTILHLAMFLSIFRPVIFSSSVYAGKSL